MRGESSIAGGTTGPDGARASRRSRDRRDPVVAPGSMPVDLNTDSGGPTR
jgi:hypothetical protein